MNERLAFFCDRDTAPCHLYTWARPDGGGEALYQVYCRRALETPEPAAGGPVIAPAAIRDWVAAADGGLIAETRQVGGGTHLRIETIPAAGYAPATELLVLRPGQEPARRPFGSGAIDLGPGTFVLLPATSADQSNLQAFLEHLDRMPGDYRGLLLNVLRRPGIEGALWKLERRLERQLEQQLDRPAAPHQAPPEPIGGRWPWVLAGLLVLNLLAVLGSAWWLTPPPAAPIYPFERMPTPVPGPNWSGCGPPWFCQEPLAPGRPKPGGGAPPGTIEIHAEKPKARP